MNLELQIQALINEAPQNGISSQQIAAIAPFLREFASSLQHLAYYILQAQDGRWLFTTISHQNHPQQQKNVIYAFSTAKDALICSDDISNIPIIVNIIDILFQLLAMDTIDSIIFFDRPGNTESGIKVSRKNFQNRLEQHLQKYHFSPHKQRGKLPPDIA